MRIGPGGRPNRRRHERGRQRGVPAVIFLVGLIGLINMMQRPRFAAFHAVDVIQLLASGMCFGIAFMALVTSFRQSHA